MSILEGPRADAQSGEKDSLVILLHGYGADGNDLFGIAQALAPHGIFVGVVAPGFVETELSATRLAGPEGPGIRAQSPLDRVARPEEVARAVVLALTAPRGVEVHDLVIKPTHPPTGS